MNQPTLPTPPALNPAALRPLYEALQSVYPWPSFAESFETSEAEHKNAAIFAALTLAEQPPAKEPLSERERKLCSMLLRCVQVLNVIQSTGEWSCKALIEDAHNLVARYDEPARERIILSGRFPPDLPPRDTRELEVALAGKPPPASPSMVEATDPKNKDYFNQPPAPGTDDLTQPDLSQPDLTQPDLAQPPTSPASEDEAFEKAFFHLGPDSSMRPIYTKQGWDACRAHMERKHEEEIGRLKGIIHQQSERTIQLQDEITGHAKELMAYYKKGLADADKEHAASLEKAAEGAARELDIFLLKHDIYGFTNEIRSIIFSHLSNPTKP